MKSKITTIACAALLFLFSAPLVSAQNLTESPKKTTKVAKKEARKQAKRKAKEGYATDAAELPMRIQFERSFKYKLATDEEGRPKYLVPTVSVYAKSKNAGKQHSIEAAKAMIAGYISSHIAGLAKSDISNNGLSPEEAESIDRVVSTYENWVVASLNDVIPVAFVHRELKNGTFEVEGTVALDLEKYNSRIRSEILKRLEEDTDIARERLENAFSPSRFQEIQNQPL